MKDIMEVRSSDRLQVVLDEISELDDRIGHDFGWASVHSYVAACHSCTVAGTADSGDRAAEIFQEGIDLAWSAITAGESIYYYEIGNTAFYFLGPIDKKCTALEKIRDQCVEQVKLLEQTKPKKTKMKKTKCFHCGK